ncbi:MAG: type II toxin-antitoxin system RelE/ParE family toxin [Bacteroidota bacterium]|nr:type II toxin-antitoxin system RelE/ParE family toxin [Bacteroidota bacterium]
MLKPLVFFERQAKKLFKKYVSLKKDLLTLVQQLKEDPEQGTALGNNCYKVRLAIDSKGKEKSGGARIITYIVVSKKNVYLLSIYDKSEKENLSDKELKELLKNILN